MESTMCTRHWHPTWVKITKFRRSEWSPSWMMPESIWGYCSTTTYTAALNEYYGEAMRKFPNRFIGLAQIREWEADQPAQIERLERGVLEHGNKGLYFSAEPFALSNFADHLDDAKFEPLWRKVRELEIPVWWYIHTRRHDRFAAFMEHVAELDRWTQRHPDIPSVLTHGLDTFGIRRGEPEQYEIPDRTDDFAKAPQHVFRNAIHRLLARVSFPRRPTYVEAIVR